MAIIPAALRGATVCRTCVVARSIRARALGNGVHFASTRARDCPPSIHAREWGPPALSIGCQAYTRARKARLFCGRIRRTTIRARDAGPWWPPMASISSITRARTRTGIVRIFPLGFDGGTFLVFQCRPHTGAGGGNTRSQARKPPRVSFFPVSPLDFGRGRSGRSGQPGIPPLSAVPSRAGRGRDRSGRHRCRRAPPGVFLSLNFGRRWLGDHTPAPPLWIKPPAAEREPARHGGWSGVGIPGQPSVGRLLAARSVSNLSSASSATIEIWKYPSQRKIRLIARRFIASK